MVHTGWPRPITGHSIADRFSPSPALLHSILFNNHFFCLFPRLKSMPRMDPMTDDSEIGPALRKEKEIFERVEQILGIFLFSIWNYSYFDFKFNFWFILPSTLPLVLKIIREIIFFFEVWVIILRNSRILCTQLLVRFSFFNILIFDSVTRYLTNNVTSKKLSFYEIAYSKHLVKNR